MTMGLVRVAPCESGWWSTTGFAGCTPCGVGAYQPSRGQTECLACPEGYRTEAVGSESESSCLAVCNLGYSGLGDDCANIDECTDGPNNCDSNAACSDTTGSFTCACAAGYVDTTSPASATGVDCISIGGCIDGPSNCDTNAACSDTAGSFTCACDPGYSGDGVACANIDEYGPSNCDTNAACSDTAGSFTCVCAAGYENNTSPASATGVDCINIDECTDGLNTCDTNAACSDTAGSFTCACDPGYSGSGTSCSQCVAGYYKNGTGAGACSACSAWTNSMEGSSNCPIEYFSSALDAIFASYPVYGMYSARVFSGNTLSDLSGNGRHAYSTSTISLRTKSGNGASNVVTGLAGSTSATMVWPVGSIPSTFTVCSVTRYDDTGSARERILACSSSSGAGSSESSIRDQSEIGVLSGGTGNCQLNINNNGEKSHWVLHSVLIWDTSLSTTTMKTVTAALSEVRPY
ncbi:hypothetical protein T484DRAFT_1860092 [Baffinella frigidus]|nr:hypothetical protein T484DRAFT_1860092 [Cryptophyta sp. CCMP2293]